MKRVNKLKLSQFATIRETLQVIDAGADKFAVVVDTDEKFLGTITDGDVRRAILSGSELGDDIQNVYNKNSIVATLGDSKERLINICRKKRIYQIPILDEEKHIVDIVFLDELLKPKSYSNRVILMVGGLGTRLRPLTETTPKPMLDVGGKPILQTIVEKFVSYGFTNITMCVGYKSKIIQDYFGDGSRFDANIDYVLEEKRMGTVGALTLLETPPTEPFFVMNGDLLTNVNFEYLLEYHLHNNSIATMSVREYDFQVPYGVVNIDNGLINSIEEKPTHKFFVSAGIYMLDSSVIKMIPEGQFYDMPTLFEQLIALKEKTLSFPLREYWLDIGRIEEYKKANVEYDEVF